MLEDSCTDCFLDFLAAADFHHHGLDALPSPEMGEHQTGRASAHVMATWVVIGVRAMVFLASLRTRLARKRDESEISVTRKEWLALQGFRSTEKAAPGRQKDWRIKL